MKSSLSSLQSVGIVTGSPNPHCPRLKFSSSSFLLSKGGGSVRSHGSGDDDFRSHVSSEAVSSGRLILMDYTGVQTLDETGVALGFSSGMTKGRKLRLPAEAFVRRGRGRKGAGGRGRHESYDRMRADPQAHDDHEWRDHRNIEDRHPDPPLSSP
ncbi:hypothetical protein Dimus_007831 [Dionaea muscipula]